MNVFFLDREPVVAAKYHCDRHVVKMIVETAQLLSTACHMVGADDNDLYKKTHVNHPSSVWVRSSRHHYVWTLRLLVALCKECAVELMKLGNAYSGSENDANYMQGMIDSAEIIREHFGV